MQVAIYCRLSEEDRDKKFMGDDSRSIQNQKSLLIQHAISQNWAIYDIYSDEDYTGADRNRPAFKRLLLDAEARKFDIVLCKTQSRFTREVELVEKYIHGLFPAWGIRFVSIVDNVDTENRDNKKSRQINALINEWYLEDMSENVRSVLRSRRNQGFHTGPFAPYGYRKDPDKKGHLLIDEPAAAVVREIFTLYSQGKGKVALARSLNARGVPSPSEYKHLHYATYTCHQSPWAPCTIARILHNEVYIGNLVLGKHMSESYKTKRVKNRPASEWSYVVNTHEPIIDKCLWDSVQTLAVKMRYQQQSDNLALFAYKTKCMYCGHSLLICKRNGNVYFKCPNRVKGCTGGAIPSSRLESIVLEELHRLSALYLDKDEVSRRATFTCDLEMQRNSILAEMNSYQSEIAECTRAINQLAMDKSQGVLSSEEYTMLMQEFLRSKQEFESLLEGCETSIAKLEKKMLTGPTDPEQYLNMQSLTREAVVMLIEYISVGRRVKGSKDTPVEIHWDF